MILLGENIFFLKEEDQEYVLEIGIVSKELKNINDVLKIVVIVFHIQ